MEFAECSAEAPFASRTPACSFSAEGFWHALLAGLHPVVLDAARKQRSRGPKWQIGELEGRPSSPHTALAGAICSHSSEFFTLELLNSGLSCQQAALL